jgi:hypothetical protein
MKQLLIQARLETGNRIGQTATEKENSMKALNPANPTLVSDALYDASIVASGEYILADLNDV